MTVVLQGDWILSRVRELEDAFGSPEIPPNGRVTLDAAGVTSLDTAGAWLLVRIIRDLESRGASVTLARLAGEQAALFELVSGTKDLGIPPEQGKRMGLFEAVGKNAVSRIVTAASILSFVGDTFLSVLRLLSTPSRIPFRAVAANIQRTGLDAVPIVGLLSFLMGFVIAYQGGVLLQIYGAQIFAADLVVLSILREIGPLITAIIAAGRSGSAFTAQIGTMKVTEEIDAMRSMGLSPLDRLVLPKIAALVISLPLLTVLSDAVGIAGGIFMADVMFGIGPAAFIERATESASLSTFLLGLVKTPVFAGLIAVVGCYQGLLVTGSAESVGRRTTVSVVQSIFLVIVTDAAFSVVFSKLGI
ncbi:MAG: MlaE family lipid ABC transporter permease subunit [Deltaproteobacteria bacterium]